MTPSPSPGPTTAPRSAAPSESWRTRSIRSRHSRRVRSSADADRSSPTTSTFRPELQGLRAVAILMVVCYHIWFDRVSGGVDIFLLISAFLLTGSFVRKLEGGRALVVPSYWLHAFKRLVPPAAVVVIATLVGVLLVLPPSRFAEYNVQALASLTYWENWHLAFQGADYYTAQRTEESPFQHFWSLSIQGQVFLLWPLVILVAGSVIRRVGLPVRRSLLVVFLAIGGMSFIWSVISTASQQQFAYFDTRTRLWEFALGSVLAICLPWLEERWRGREGGTRRENGVSRTVRSGAGWAGMVLILSCGLIVDVEGAFPGWIALWPLLAACLVIAAGATGSRWGVDRILSSAPLQKLGDISYALYLVHWPLLIFTAYRAGTGTLPLGTAILVVLASLLLAWVLTRLVDTPFRSWRWAASRWWRSLGVTALALVLAAAPIAVLDMYLQRPMPTAGSPGYPGAAALAPGASPSPAPGRLQPFVPALEVAEKDWVGFPDRCAMPEQVAVLCDELRNPSPTRTIIAYGNSHAQQALGTLVPAAMTYGWALERPTIGGCAYVVGEDQPPECNLWNYKVTQYIVEQRPTAVLMVSTRTSSDPNHPEEPMPGYEQRVKELLDEGIDVISVRDTPRFRSSVPDCVAENRDDQDACGAPRHEVHELADPTPFVASESGARVFHLDFSDQLCPDGECSPVIGNVLVYFDDNHLSKSYATTLAPFAEDALRQQGFFD